MSTAYGQHQIVGEAPYREYPENIQQPLPNPLLSASSQAPSSTSQLGQQGDPYYNRGPEPTPSQRQWADPNVRATAIPRQTREDPDPYWDSAEVDVSDGDASMADSDDEADHLDALALARAQKHPEAWSSSHHFMGSSGGYGRTNMLSDYLGSPHLSVFKSAELRRVFRHFIETTGPMISLYERPPYRCPGGSGDYSLWSCECSSPVYLELPY
jgi:hypothetical protein